MGANRIGWSQPRNMTDHQYHYTDCSTRCLCGKYDTSALLDEREHRRPVIITDAPKCVEAWQKKYEPNQRVYERP